MQATTTIKIGSKISSIALILGLMDTAKQAATTANAGTRTKIRRHIITTFCKVVTSLVIRVVSDAVENWSMFLKEKWLILRYISPRSR